MRLDDALRRSSYVTVALATACLGLAEWPFLAEIPFIVGAVAVVLILAYRLENRWRLSARAANGLGLIIAGGWTAWIIYSFPQTGESLGTSPLPIRLLPYIGPMLMVLLLVKLFRPKRISDYWYLHGIGLVEVALACVLTGEAGFGVLLFLYLASALWSLMIFNIYREQAVVSGQLSVASEEDATNLVGQENQGEKKVSLATNNWKLTTALPWPYLGLLHAGYWMAAITAVGFLSFLLLPQRGDADSITAILSGKASHQTGFSPSEMDLNQTGTIEIDDKPAFEVFAEDAEGNPKLDLSPTVRWRGAILDHYDTRGRWGHGYQLLFSFQPRPQLTLPDVGPDQYFLTLYVDTRQSHGLFLAEPVVFSPSQGLPYISLAFEEKPMEGMDLFQARDGTLFPALLPRPAKLTYRQVCLPVAGNSIGPSYISSRDQDNSLTQRLLQQPIRGIREWTTGALQRLVTEGRLTSEDVRTTAIPRSGLWPEMPILAAEKRAKVARALSDFLALSGEYSYTLELRREDYNMDPTEDFLRNVKEGHCERFATGLALMLRSAGVPCRVVKGFRGADTRDGTGLGDGWYVVRHSHAHAWVEALAAGNEDKKLGWLTLDPSPVAVEGESRTFPISLWPEISWFWLRNQWRKFVLEYNVDQQRETAQDLWNRFSPLRRFGSGTGPVWLVGGAAFLAGVMWFRRRKPRQRGFSPRLSPEFAFYGRLQAVLARYCRLTLQPGQTPLEFAATARQLLRSATAVIPLADIPVQIIRQYYRVRYGRQPLDSAERQAIDQQINDLAGALRKIEVVKT
jgi:protein-glutamine gamma-glutamyltransferase